MDRRDLDDLSTLMVHTIRAEAKQTRLEVGEKVRSVGMWPAVLGAIVAALLTTGAVMFFWGILPK